MDKLGALIFDCDGTLVDSAPIYAEAWTQGFAISGIVMDKAWYKANHGLSEGLLLDAFERLHRVKLNHDSVIALARATFLERLSDLQEYTPVAEIARACAGKVPMAVASGGPRQIVEASLEITGLIQLFTHIVTFDDVPVAKPDPTIFRETANRIGVSPENCLVFEDSPIGMLAAKRAGMNVIDVTENSLFW